MMRPRLCQRQCRFSAAPGTSPSDQFQAKDSNSRKRLSQLRQKMMIMMMIMTKKRPRARMERRRNPARTKLNVQCYQISGKRTRGPTLSRTCPQISTSLLISQFKGMHGGTRTLLQTMAGCDVAPENGRFLFEPSWHLGQFWRVRRYPIKFLGYSI